MKNRLMFPAAIPLFALSVFSVDAAPLHSGLTDSLGNGRPIVFVQDAKGECDPAQQECPPNEGEHKKKDGAHEQKPPKHEEPAAQPPAAEPAKPEPKPEAKPEPKPEPKPELKPEPKAESKPEPQGEAKPEPKPEPKAEAPKQDMKVQDIEPPKPSEEGRPELKPGTKHDARKPKPPVNEDLAKPVPPEPKAAEPAPRCCRSCAGNDQAGDCADPCSRAKACPAAARLCARRGCPLRKARQGSQGQEARKRGSGTGTSCQ